MKKLFFLNTLLAISAGNIFAMHPNNNDGQVPHYNNPPQVIDNNNDASDSDDEHINLSNVQFRQRVQARIQRNEYATATGLLMRWRRYLAENPRSAEAMNEIDNFERLHGQIQTNARNNGQGQKERFIRLAQNATQTINLVRAAVPNNN